MNPSHFFKHYLRHRPRLLISVLAGVLCFFLLPSSISWLQRLMIAWNLLAFLYLVLLSRMMLRSNTRHIREVAKTQDESARVVLFMVCIACVVSILVILLDLGTANNAPGSAKTLHLLLTGSTLMLSWLLLPTAFAMHYAHLYYRQSASDGLGLIFPNNLVEPSYWDFLYFSFIIGVASQTADVSIGSSDIRKVSLLQSVLSFIFNMAILGLSINVGASLIG